MARAFAATSSPIVAIEEQTRTRGSAGLTHVFSSSYLGRLFKNPFSLTNIAPFKMRPMRTRADRYALPERPMTGRACTTCFDSEHSDQWNQPTAIVEDKSSSKVTQRARLSDVLELPSNAYKASYNFVKRIADFLYCLKLNVNLAYPRVDADVLKSDLVKDGINKNVSRHMDDEEDTFGSFTTDFDSTRQSRRHQRIAVRMDELLAKERNRAVVALNRMCAHISGWTLKITAYVLFKLLRVLLRTVQISPNQVEQIKKAYEEQMPVIYLPNHRSHLDYILLTFVLAQFGFRAPYVAAGDNLDMPVFSWILRSLGAFFIKRRLDKDNVYRAVLHSYIEEVLKRGESLEFFVEAGRSRTGRPILPKAGLLSVVVETYLQGHIPNAYIVPVSVSYEKLIEGNFSRELMGEPKQKESFWAAIKGIWNVFCTKYGSVRVDFGQPVTMKDFIGSLREHLPPLPVTDGAMATSAFFDLCNIPQRRLSKSMSSRNSLLSLCSGIDSTFITDENRRLIKAMCNHIVYDFSRNTALMCTQMLAFLLTTKYRHGGRLDDIVDDFHWLCRRTIANGRDIGFSGDPRDVVRYAVELLGADLVSSEISDVDSGVGSDSGLGGGGWNAIGSGARYEKDTTNTESHLWIVKPTITLPSAIELAYYAAPVSLVFLQEAVVANALLSASLEAGKWSSKPNSSIHSSKIIDRALALTDLLQHEFLFAKPCVSIRQTLEQTLERMVQDGLLVKRPYSSTSSLSTSSTHGVRFCLDKNQTFPTTISTIASSTESSHGSASSLNALDDEGESSPSIILEKPTIRKRRMGPGEAFYFASEDDELADYEDEMEEDEDDELFDRRSNSSISQRRASYGIAALLDSDDAYNADVIRLYASTLAPLLESYKFAFKTALNELAQPAPAGGLIKSQWMSESELIRRLITAAKEDGSSFSYAEAVNIEAMRNAVRWFVQKGVLISNHERIRLHDTYIDDRETLDRFCSDIDDLCVVVTY